MWRVQLESKGIMFRGPYIWGRLYVPTAMCSHNCIFPLWGRFYVSTSLCSHDAISPLWGRSFVPHNSIIPTIWSCLCSQGAMFTELYIPAMRTCPECSNGSMFPQVYISDIGTLSMFPELCIPRTQYSHYEDVSMFRQLYGKSRTLFFHYLGRAYVPTALYFRYGDVSVLSNLYVPKTLLSHSHPNLT